MSLVKNQSSNSAEFKKKKEKKKKNVKSQQYYSFKSSQQVNGEWFVFKHLDFSAVKNHV